MVFPYECSYGLGPRGNIGRLYAKNSAPQRISRRMRQIAYQGLDIRDFDVEAAHFSIALQAVEKLHIDIPCPYFTLANVRHYLLNKREIRGNLALGYKGGKFRPPNFFKKLFTSISQGGDIPPEHSRNETMQGISREGRLMRWLVAAVQPDLYATLCDDTECKWPESSAMAFFSRD